MIRYKKYQMTGENHPLKGLWYARPLIEDTFDTEKLAKHMSNHNTPYSAGLIKGVLTDMIAFQGVVFTGHLILLVTNHNL